MAVARASQTTFSPSSCSRYSRSRKTRCDAVAAASRAVARSACGSPAVGESRFRPHHGVGGDGGHLHRAVEIPFRSFAAGLDFREHPGEIGGGQVDVRAGRIQLARDEFGGHVRGLDLQLGAAHSDLQQSLDGAVDRRAQRRDAALPLALRERRRSARPVRRLGRQPGGALRGLQSGGVIGFQPVEQRVGRLRAGERIARGLEFTAQFIDDDDRVRGRLFEAVPRLAGPLLLGQALPRCFGLLEGVELLLVRAGERARERESLQDVRQRRSRRRVARRLARGLEGFERLLGGGECRTDLVDGVVLDALHSSGRGSARNARQARQRLRARRAEGGGPGKGDHGKGDHGQCVTTLPQLLLHVLAPRPDCCRGRFCLVRNFRGCGASAPP
jgi:hypothetical protein